MNNKPPAIHSPSTTTGRPLTNAEAKPIAERFYAELAAEFDGAARRKIIENLRRIHDRENLRTSKDAQVRQQVERAGNG